MACRSDLLSRQRFQVVCDVQADNFFLIVQGVHICGSRLNHFTILFSLFELAMVLPGLLLV